jgi:diguanylate cyclase (GGDEF)-like protein
MIRSPHLRQVVLRLRPVALALLVGSALLLSARNLFDLQLGLPDRAWYVLFDSTIVLSGLMCAVFADRRERVPWGLIGAGVALWGLGDAYWINVLSGMESPPYPSPSDVLWLLFYPPVYLGLFLLLRARRHVFRASLVLDGLIGALAVAAVGSAVVLPAVIDASSGRVLAVITNLAYPIADTTLLALVAVAFALTSWRPDRSWLLLALGLLLFGAADSFYVYQVAHGTYVVGTVIDLGWVLGPVTLAIAAATRARPLRIVQPGLTLLAMPVVFAVVALGLLVWDHYRPLVATSLFLAGACVLAVIARLVLTFRENVVMLRARTDEADTDALTGLPNRRRLMADLDDAIQAHHPTAVLALFDLNGFKQYNDTFGHPAGDALLRRLGRNLADAVAPSSRAYRMGGDEFCVLAEPVGRMGALVEEAVDALTEEGGGFMVSAAHGQVELSEVRDAVEALHFADQRMYANKNSHRASATEQASNVLHAALLKHDPAQGDHSRGVSELAVGLGEALGLDPGDLETVRIAAVLHDVGKLAIPEAILSKPGPLDEEEWAFVRTHTLIGETIMQAAPALASAARLVRSSHERFDGSGYPDGLAGADIPLGSRIIVVCDAFDAMLTERRYAPAMTVEQALAELRRHAGTQFDPDAVTAFCALIARRSEIPGVTLASVG